ncbi:putative E3 ubiquitin-protein ligase UBR7 [Aricia agestis]|uniref:putative E3 ubiquitin-protein ligase UBR7 n=1 Tax=Aricia agestis TaxID=91739 RepID=UPI001C204D4D|nr:putative E3 ubiquitin-protein ligase UBR7 [Aricia agestis]
MEENTVTATEDTEMEDCDGHNVVTMMDVLKEQEDFENNANAVLGASDEKNCTYSKGYVKRQAIYACMTCCSGAKDDPSKRAGVCLACSLTCHENHELIELYTKRNFRCDCGNPKFDSNPCQYTSTKSDLNENNEYNQNFSGLYCICHRPYPDPESTIEDEMIQCIICEDWLHANHLEATVPSNDQYSEMICKGCMEKNSFLHDYSSLAVNIENDVDVVVDTPKITNLNGNHIENENLPLTPQTKSLDNSNDNNINTESNMEKQEQADTTKEKTQLEDERMEEDRLLADPEEENKLKNNGMDGDHPGKEDKTIDASEPVGIKDDATNKEADQLSCTSKKEDENTGETDGNDISSDVKKDDSADNTSTSPNKNENNEANTKVDKGAEVDQTADKTEAKESTDINLDTEIKNTGDQEEATEKASDDLDVADTKDSDKNEIDANIEIKNNKDMVTENTNEDTNKSENKRKLSTENSTDVDTTAAGKRVKLDSSCIRPKNIKKTYKGATFWPSDFRQKLCTCNECLTMYKDLSVLFLTDFDDTVTAYESLGEEKERIEGKPASQYEKGLQALSSLDRIQQINALTEYNKMKDKLLDFLKTFKERKEVVKEEDIKEFFAGMKPKREPDGVYFCR